MIRRYIIIFITLITIQIISVNCIVAQTKDNFVKVSSSNPKYFELNNKIWIPIEINLPIYSYGKMGLNDLNYITKIFATFRSNGGNSVRLLLGESAFDFQNSQFGKVDTSKLIFLDKIIKLAGEYNLHIKCCIETIKSFSNTEHTGRNALLNVNGGILKNFSDYLNTSEGRKLYLERARMYISRYAKNSTIYAWELWNEINSIKDANWINFCQNIFPQIKKIAPNQLLTVSLGSMGSDFNSLSYYNYSKLKENDIYEIHQYISPVVGQADSLGNLDNALYLSIKQASKFSLKIPIFINETGAVKPHHTGDSPILGVDTLGVMLDDALYVPLFSGASAPASMWQIGGYVGRNGLWTHYKVFSQILKSIVWSNTENFSFFYKKQPDITIYGFGDQVNSFFYIRNNLPYSNLKTLDSFSIKLPEKLRNRVVKIIETGSGFETNVQLHGCELTIRHFCGNLLLKY